MNNKLYYIKNNFIRKSENRKKNKKEINKQNSEAEDYCMVFYCKF